jgi:hypothetical protein
MHGNQLELTRAREKAETVATDVNTPITPDYVERGSIASARKASD